MGGRWIFRLHFRPTATCLSAAMVPLLSWQCPLQCAVYLGGEELSSVWLCSSTKPSLGIFLNIPSYYGEYITFLKYKVKKAPFEKQDWMENHIATVKSTWRLLRSLINPLGLLPIPWSLQTVLPWSWSQCWAEGLSPLLAPEWSLSAWEVSAKFVASSEFAVDGHSGCNYLLF